jgi:hypothetical protein
MKQEAQLTASGELSGQAVRTVHDEPRGLSGTHPHHGPSAGSTRTVRQAPADRPPFAADRLKLRPTETKIATDRNDWRARTRRTRDEP